jgi:hypothetical protein
MVMRYLLGEIPDDGTYGVPKHVDLLTSDVCIYFLHVNLLCKLITP